MERQARGQTTAPAWSTDGIAETDAIPAVRWVFPSIEGKLSLLPNSRVLLGRGDDCSIPLPGKETSRHHADIRRDGPIFILRDLQSRNGVFLNGERIREAPLSPGDVLRLGEWLGIVTSLSPTRTVAQPIFRRVAEGLYAGPPLAPVLELARRAAAGDLPIVLEGETGTGKERFARAIHGWSGRKGAFVGVNCAALPESLAEAELFGYRKGAFTGADRNSPGHFRAAEGGTLLLDEIIDLPGPIQAKLLRALEEREVVPLGESHPIPIDVRILAASQEPLAKAVAGKRFRADLSARLDGLTLRLPPLRDRREEIVFLFVELLRDHAGGRAPELEPRLLEQLCLYAWPLNVRELDLLARRLLTLHGDEPLLRRAHLPDRFLAAPRASVLDERTPAPDERTPAATPPGGPLAERSHEDAIEALTAALRAHAGNVARAAAALGISRQRAYRLIEGKEGIDLAALRSAAEEGRADEK